MRTWIAIWMILLAGAGGTIQGSANDYHIEDYGQLLPGSTDEVGLWWASSGWKVRPDKPLPKAKSDKMVIRVAKNETEAAQLVIRPTVPLDGLVMRIGRLRGPGGETLAVKNTEILECRYVDVTTPTDRSAVTGLWPDPLPPMRGPVSVPANRNQAFWIRVSVPKDARAGTYEGTIDLTDDGYTARVPLSVEVYDFQLPDRMTCVTAFGFSPGNVYRYQKLKTDAQKRQVLDKYWANFSDHHISPYNPAPMDPIRVTWPDVKPTPSKWQGAEKVKNEKHGGQSSLLIFDDLKDKNVQVEYASPIEIPKDGLRLKFWYRSAIEGQGPQVTLNHYDAAGQWMSGRNNDMSLDGNGQWQEFDRTLTDFPEGARSVRLILRAAYWTDAGDRTGLVWFDDISLTDVGTGAEQLEGGNFEPSPLPEVERDKLRVKLDFSAWDRAMTQAIDRNHFNSFRLSIPGMGGGTFHARYEPQLLGFGEDTPHYQILFNDYCGQIERHLRAKGWLDEAFVYWFDEPDPKDYAFVNNGFAKLKAAAPGIDRMLTEQVEPGLIGGPNIWCPVSPRYDHESAEQRRAEGESFWWYVCTGPKAPWCTLFIDHPGTELRVWLWQTWQRKIAGILVWQTNYWTSSAAYPDAPQNPYADPMGWRSGYSTPAGEKRPWGNGDGRFIYPPLAAADAKPAGPVLDGPVDSIRWEMLRDGIEDYEYFVMLKRLIETKGRTLSTDKKARYSALLQVPKDVTENMTVFTKDPAPIEEHRDRLARAIVELSRR